LGNPTDFEKECYTRVLKGHIDLAKIKFPRGVKGAHLDVLARSNLWQNFMDYAHGTGHGVGHFLSVHESPPNISRAAINQIPLAEGMVISNEPGYYIDGKFGIRLESLVVVKESEHPSFLEFETMTLVPFQGNLIAREMMDKSQLDWLDNYQESVVSIHKHNLSPHESDWLIRHVKSA